MHNTPPEAVLNGFVLSGDAEALPGGRGTAWRVGNMVIKPADLSAQELAWQADLHGSLAHPGLRVSYPLPARDGRFLVEGWSAWPFLPGRHEARRWLDIIQVGERFHRALADVPRPTFLDARTDPWAVADRVAWGESPFHDFLGVRHLRRLAAYLRPVTAPSGLIHGDLTGNVLFSEAHPPAVIDFSPYWRPAVFASAIVVADALVWQGADERLVAAVAHLPDFAQGLLRALIFRRVTEELLGVLLEEPDPYLPAVDLACRLVQG